MKGYAYHTKAAIEEWKGQSWQLPGEKPFQLFWGIGFAGIFYDYYSGSAAQKLKAFQLVHLSTSLLRVLALAVFFRIKRKLLSDKIFSLASLKIYLAVFYHFAQIPYDYLFTTPIFVSIPIIWLALEHRIRARADASSAATEVE